MKQSIWFKQTGSTFHELLKRNTSTPIQYHGDGFHKEQVVLQSQHSILSSSRDILQHTATLTCRNAL